MGEWFRAHWKDLFFSSYELKSFVGLCNSQLVCLCQLGFLTSLRLFENFVSVVSVACL